MIREILSDYLFAMSFSENLSFPFPFRGTRWIFFDPTWNEE
jgi:hypothetical protein